MPLSRVYYHIIWATKDRLPLITSDLEEMLWQHIVSKASALGAIVHAIGGTDDHIHLVVSIPPKLAVAEAIGQLKGASAHWVNEHSKESFAFGWQREYGVFSLGAKQLDEAVDYVRRQKARHAEGDLISWLERADGDGGGPAFDRDHKLDQQIES